ncbi:MAG: UvrD-helicase domain-containing protein [Chloroflexota bacterium]
MHLLEGLNDAQRDAITAGTGPVLVLAGPGSGKTRVLTHRIAYLVQEMKVPAWHILAVTFTNKAAKEMNERIEALLEGSLRGLTMGTFHAVCARILRREAENLTHYDQNFVIFDTADQLQVMKQALKDLNLDDKKFPPNKIRNAIGQAKNELITPDLYNATNYIAEVTRRVYTRYQEILHANNAMDFDDLLMNTVLLFDERPEILQRYQERYQYILVDEFQDTNTTQYALLHKLTATHHNIFAVGDADQSIYKWRGADFRNIQRFREEYPKAQMILLEQNYRSTQIILDAAKAVIRRNSDRVDKELFTERQGGRQIVVREAYNENEEAETIVATIERHLLDGYRYADTAVMYRTNFQSRALEETLLRVGIPYKLVGATEFYKRREIKDIIAFLRLIHNPADEISFGRILNVPPRSIGAKTRQDLLDWAARHGWQPATAVIELATSPDINTPFSGRALGSLFNFGEMLHAWITIRDHATVAELIDLVLENTGYKAYIDDGTPEGEERWANVMEFRGVAVSDTGRTLGEFLEQVSLVSETDNLEEQANAVTLLTFHAAKGLEYPVVFLTGLEDGLLPHSRSLEDGEELAEERRLFYVGITRAKDVLYISHAFRRTTFGDSSVSAPSRFLRDIPPELTEGGETKQRRQETVSRASSWSSGRSNTSWSGSSSRSSTSSRKEWTPPARPKTPPAASEPPRSRLPKPNYLRQDVDVDDEPRQTGGGSTQYRTGQKVRHIKFGEGTVIESKLTGSDEEVTVAFPSEGIKRLAASFARLEIVKE